MDTGPGWVLSCKPKVNDPEETFTLPGKSVVEVATVVMEKEEVGMMTINCYKLAG